MGHYDIDAELSRGVEFSVSSILRASLMNIASVLYSSTPLQVARVSTYEIPECLNFTGVRYRFRDQDISGNCYLAVGYIELSQAHIYRSNVVVGLVGLVGRTTFIGASWWY